MAKAQCPVCQSSIRALLCDKCATNDIFAPSTKRASLGALCEQRDGVLGQLQAALQQRVRGGDACLVVVWTERMTLHPRSVSLLRRPPAAAAAGHPPPAADCTAGCTGGSHRSSAIPAGRSH
jgi:hypothetical protein